MVEAKTVLICLDDEEEDDFDFTFKDTLPQQKDPALLATFEVPALHFHISNRHHSSSSSLISDSSFSLPSSSFSLSDTLAHPPPLSPHPPLHPPPPPPSLFQGCRLQPHTTLKSLLKQTLSQQILVYIKECPFHDFTPQQLKTHFNNLLYLPYDH